MTTRIKIDLGESNIAPARPMKPEYFRGLISDRQTERLKAVMAVESQKLIRQVFYDLEDEFPGKSHAFLFEMVVQRFRPYVGYEITHSDVAEALGRDK